MPEKRYLLTPGPTPVPPEVLSVLGEPVLHHRSPDFKRAYASVLARMPAMTWFLSLGSTAKEPMSLSEPMSKCVHVCPSSVERQNPCC